MSNTTVYVISPLFCHYGFPAMDGSMALTVLNAWILTGLIRTGWGLFISMTNFALSPDKNSHNM